MNKFSTATQVKPHHTISPEIWERFVVEYPKCSAEVRVQQDDFLVKYQSLSATMMASILEQIVCWQNFKDFYGAYQVLSKHQSIPQLKDFITDVLRIMNTMMQNLQPLEKQKLSNLKQADKYTFLSDYLRRNREFIYGKLIQPEGEEALCKLSRGVALSYYLNSQFDQNTAVQKYLNRVSKDIIIETLIKGIPRERKNLFILDDIEVVALSHIFSMPIHFYINCCERESTTLTRRRIHSNNIERTTAILIELPLINRYRILFQHSENAYLKFLSDESVNKQVLDFEPLIQIQESVINFITLKYAEINHQWISKIIQIIQNQDVNLIIATQSLQFPAHFRPQIIQNISKLGIAQSQISLFLLNFETIFKQSVEMFEQIVIQEVSKVRQQFEVYHKQKRKLSQSNQKEIQYPEEKPINQVPQTHKFLTSNSLFGNHIKPTQFQEQKRLSVVGKIEAKQIEQDYPFSDTEENVIHQVSEIIVEAKEYNTSSDEEKHNEFDYEAILKGQINNMRNSHIIQTSLHEDNLRNSHLIQNSLHDVQNEVSEEMEYASQQKQNFLRQSRSLIDSGRKSERKSSTETLNFNLNNSRNSNVQKKMSNSQILRTSQRQSYRGSLQNKNFQHNLEQSQILEVNESQLQSQFFFFECPICLESISREEDIRFIHDDHKICKLCLESWVKIKFNAGQWNFKYFSCPIQVVLGGKSVHCGQVINQDQIKQVLTPEEYRILQEKAMKRGIIDIICPNNSCQCIIKGMIPKSKDGLICPQCKQKICWVCKNCDHQGQKCPQRLEDIRQALKDERVSCCPQCLEIYMKNEGCEHVQCTNCLIDFCFSCSAPRLPIENHGGHYHRVGCQVRIPWINPITQKEVLDDEFEPDQCELCKIHQKACIRPIPLEDFQNLAHLKF